MIKFMEPFESRVRPIILDEYIGQEHLFGSGPSPSPLSVAIETKHLFSFLLWGSSGAG